MQEAAVKTESLSTLGEMNPLRLLEAYGTERVVLCVVAIWTRHTMTGSLEEKGVWIRSFWESAMKALPGVAGSRLGWNTVFFAVPDADVEQITQRFTDLLQASHDGCLMSFCAICGVKGEPEHKLDVLDVLGHEVGAIWEFGTSREYLPNGYRFYHLLDGKPYLIK